MLSNNRVIEDALEIEYREAVFNERFQGENSFSPDSKNGSQKLPSIGSSVKSPKKKEDILALKSMINDIEDLIMTPNVRVLLPRDFPSKRNPFMLGKSVDELAGKITDYLLVLTLSHLLLLKISSR